MCKERNLKISPFPERIQRQCWGLSSLRKRCQVRCGERCELLTPLNRLPSRDENNHTRHCCALTVR